MIYPLLYLTIGGVLAVPFSDTLRAHTGDRFEYVVAICVTVVAWPFILLNAIALIYTHWDDVE